MNYYKKNTAVFYSSLISIFFVFSTIKFTNVIYIEYAILFGMIAQLIFCYIYTKKIIGS